MRPKTLYDPVSIYKELYNDHTYRSLVREFNPKTDEDWSKVVLYWIENRDEVLELCKRTDFSDLYQGEFECVPKEEGETRTMAEELALEQGPKFNILKDKDGNVDEGMVIPEGLNIGTGKIEIREGDMPCSPSLEVRTQDVIQIIDKLIKVHEQELLSEHPLRKHRLFSITLQKQQIKEAAWLIVKNLITQQLGAESDSLGVAMGNMIEILNHRGDLDLMDRVYALVLKMSNNEDTEALNKEHLRLYQEAMTKTWDSYISHKEHFMAKWITFDTYATVIRWYQEHRASEIVPNYVFDGKTTLSW